MNEVHLKGSITRLSTTNHWVWVSTDWGEVRCIWPDDNNQLQQGFEALEMKDEILIVGHLTMRPASGSMVRDDAHVRITWCEALRPARRAKAANDWFQNRTRTIVNNEMYSDWYEKRYQEARDSLDTARNDARNAINEKAEMARELESTRERYKEAVMSGLIGGSD